MRVLGLDPGLRHTGWGVIDVAGNRLHHVADGVVHAPTDLPLAERLVALFRALTQVLERFRPDEAAVEESFVNKNAASTLKLGVARGVVLPPPGGAARLLIETHVREDHIHLYGFIDAAERDWFRLLTTVQGVGARLALAILSAVAPEALTLAIVAQDKAVLSRADGVGPRLAARIANEL